MERKGATPSKVKLLVADDISLKNLVQKAITKLVDNVHPTADETANERMLKLKDLFIHCGAQADEEDDGFLLKLPQLRERNLTGGKNF